MPSIVIALVFFALYVTDTWGQGGQWLAWAIVNFAIGAVLILADAIRDRR